MLLSDYWTNLVFAVFDRPNLVAHRYNTTSEEFTASRQDEALRRSMDVDYFTAAHNGWTIACLIFSSATRSIMYCSARNRALTCQLSFFPSAFEELYRDEAYSLYQVKWPIQSSPTIQANSWLLEGNLQSAFSAYQDDLNKNPDLLPALLGVAEVYGRNGEPSLALGYLLQAEQGSVNNPCVLKSLANGYFNIDDLDQAAGYYQQAITASPWDEHLFRALGDIYLLQDRFDEAKTAYGQAIQIQMDIDPFSFKEIRTTQVTKTGIPTAAPGNFKRRGYSQDTELPRSRN